MAFLYKLEEPVGSQLEKSPRELSARCLVRAITHFPGHGALGAREGYALVYSLPRFPYRKR